MGEFVGAGFEVVCGEYYGVGADLVVVYGCVDYVFIFY